MNNILILHGFFVGYISFSREDALTLLRIHTVNYVVIMYTPLHIFCGAQLQGR